MKRIFTTLTIILTLCTSTLLAQSSQLATLSHNGEISIFYGSYSLKEALAAADHGDVIALSGGIFKATDIKKAITLRGAGWEGDTIKHTIPTKIEGSVTINIEDSTKHPLTIEGIDFQILYVKGNLDNATFVKNKSFLIQYIDEDTCSYKNNTFIQCYFDDLGQSSVLYYRVAFAGPIKFTPQSTFKFVNCVIEGGINNNKVSSTFTNSVINNSNKKYAADSTYRGYFVDVYYSVFYNCILYGYNSYYGSSANNNADRFNSTNFLYNCVGVNIYKNDLAYNYSPTNKIATASELFVKDGYPYILTEEAKAKYLGSDSTQVGIYGGPFTFTSATTNPQITKCKVASRSTADGKLSVDIEVSAGE